MRHVPHLWVPGPWHETVLRLDDDQVHHLRRVLRLTDGSAVTYTDGVGRRGEGTFVDGGVARGGESIESPGRRLTIAVAPPDSKDRVRFLVEKLGELGTRRLVWLRTAHGQGRPPRSDRARSWAVGALEQSRGAWMMEIDDGESTLDRLPPPVLVADPEGEEPASFGLGPDADVTVAVGPEGGWGEGEAEQFPRVKLARTVLRVETAAVVAATVFSR